MLCHVLFSLETVIFENSIVGHIFRGNDISSDLFTGMVYGKRGRGRPKTRFSDNVKEIEDCAKDGGEEFFTEMHLVRIANL